MILTPDAFLNDPLGWIGNQSAHALFIGCGLFALAAITPLSRREAFGVVLALYGAWEVWTFAGDFIDGATDLSFVAMGAAFGWMAWEGKRDKIAMALAGLVIAGAAGVWVRI